MNEKKQSSLDQGAYDASSGAGRLAGAQAGQRLGRGLSALLGDMANSNLSLNDVSRVGREQRSVAVELIRANRSNPRKHFDEAHLLELAQSIQSKGLIQPLIVRPVSETPYQYELIAGERRWRAAQMAQLQNVPVVVLNVDGRVAAELALIENIQREDLNPIEEALGYRMLIDQNGYTQDALADLVGKSRSAVANSLRLLLLPDPVQDFVVQGVLSVGHVKVLVGRDDAVSLAQKIIRDGLSVRQVEEMIQLIKSPSSSVKSKTKSAISDAKIVALQNALRDSLGAYVAVKDRGGAGVIQLRYKDAGELERLVALLGQRSV